MLVAGAGKQLAGQIGVELDVSRHGGLRRRRRGRWLRSGFPGPKSGVGSPSAAARGNQRIRRQGRAHRVHELAAGPAVPSSARLHRAVSGWVIWCRWTKQPGGRRDLALMASPGRCGAGGWWAGRLPVRREL